MALTWPLEQEGSTGEDVKTVQYLVTAQGHSTGVDGVFGPLTKTAVEAFQSSRGLGADGTVGPQTWPQLIIQVQQGSNGDAVRAVQSQIHSRGDGAQIPIDGVFGPDTNDAVRAFQMLLGLSVDGIVGLQTWNHLVNGYLAAPDPQTAAQDVFSAWEADNRDQAAKNHRNRYLSSLVSDWMRGVGLIVVSGQGVSQVTHSYRAAGVVAAPDGGAVSDRDRQRLRAW